MVAISALVFGDSPRLSGEDREHTNVLAQTEQPLPPILVHRPTMRIIDGLHRVQAAKLQGEEEIAATFFEGDEDTAFVLAVQSNISHGLPLTLRERTAAAERILSSHSDWSDRAIARATGLSAPTVGAIRQRTVPDSPQFETRRGRDGKNRPLNTAAAKARIRASELIAKKPYLSLRQIATEAGTSTATARDVRRRLARGDSPVPLKQRKSDQHSSQKEDSGQKNGGALVKLNIARRGQIREPGTVLQLLRRDPSLRSTESGRALLKWLTAQTASVEKRMNYLDRLPPHCSILIVEIFRGLAQTWQTVADELDQKMRVRSEEETQD
jgi:ParB-like chromosome segregation protein Spo0J